MIPLHTFAVPCTHQDLIDYPGTPIPNPCDSLTVNLAVDMSTKPGPIVINVTGDVNINANLTLDGSPGITAALGNNVPGGVAGPGAGNGGGTDGFSTPMNGDDPFPGSGTAPGKAAPNDFACANGGGGGALFSNGAAGATCPTTGTLPGDGGVAVFGTEFDFGGNFRGGYGGGAGGTRAAEVAPGGGGGGALHITAGGNVTIATGVTISLRGGKGADSAVDGGGGGGGSGGALWIQSTGGIITNLGTINLTGGDPGESFNNLSDGGRGGDGVLQFDDLNGTINDSGLVSPPGTGTNSISRAKLSSDISCGTIAKENNNNNILYTMMTGFFLVSLLSTLISGIRMKKVLRSKF